MNVAILILDSYIDIAKALEGIAVGIFDVDDLDKFPDMLNLEIISRKEEGSRFELLDFKSEVERTKEIDEILKKKNASLLDVKALINMLKRVRSPEDTLALYDQSTTLRIYSSDIIEDVGEPLEIRVYSDLMYKGQDIPKDMDYIFIVDITEENMLNNIEQMETIVNNQSAICTIITNKLEICKDNLQCDWSVVNIEEFKV